MIYKIFKNGDETLATYDDEINAIKAVDEARINIKEQLYVAIKQRKRLLSEYLDDFEHFRSSSSDEDWEQYEKLTEKIQKLLHETFSYKKI